MFVSTRITVSVAQCCKLWTRIQGLRGKEKNIQTCHVLFSSALTSYSASPNECVFMLGVIVCMCVWVD